MIRAHHRHVSRDHDDIEAIDLAEFKRFGVRGAGHAGELAVEPEVVLERGRCERLRFVLNRYILLRFDRLVDSLRPASPGHRAAGMLIDDNNLTFRQHIVDVTLEQDVRLQRRMHVVQKIQIRCCIEAVACP